MLKLMGLVIAILAAFTARASSLDKRGILRDSSGRMINLTHDGAVRACPQGKHLATAKDLGVLAQSFGAKGNKEIESTCPIFPREMPNNYNLIPTEREENQFYFNSHGYKMTGDMAGSFFWSSDQTGVPKGEVFEREPTGSTSEFWGLNGTNGDLRPDWDTEYGAVVCVDDASKAAPASILANQDIFRCGKAVEHTCTCINRNGYSLQITTIFSNRGVSKEILAAYRTYSMCEGTIKSYSQCR